jgi:pyruvate-ferredoxin/flavodoxin oxidoreductase
LAEGLLNVGSGSAAVAELLASLPAVTTKGTGNGSGYGSGSGSGNGSAKGSATPSAIAAEQSAEQSAEPHPEPHPEQYPIPADVVAEDEGISLDPYIDSVMCTSCNECINLNNKMFAYNADKQATIKDPHAGTFQQLVLAAEKCPVSIIHPGTPLDPKEKDLPKWMKRAERFN